MLRKIWLIIILATNFSDLLSTDHHRPFYHDWPGRIAGLPPTSSPSESLFGTRGQLEKIVRLTHQIINSTNPESFKIVIYNCTHTRFNELTISLILDSERRIINALLSGFAFEVSIPVRNKRDLFKLIRDNDLHYYIEEEPAEPTEAVFLSLSLQSARGLVLGGEQERIVHTEKPKLAKEVEELHAESRRFYQWSPISIAWTTAVVRSQLRKYPVADPAMPGLPKPIRSNCKLM